MGRILLVEDDTQIREHLMRMLSRAGHGVITAGEGEEALHYLDKGNVDLMITDLIMPGKEGIQTIREAKEKCPSLPIIAISGGGRLNPNELLPLAKMIGAIRVFPKPFEVNDLIEAVEELINSSTHES